MTLAEALNEYSISVPTDDEFYSQEYIDYFNDGKKDGSFEVYRPFQEMYTKSFCSTFFSSNEQDNSQLSYACSNAVVLGGQTGAGKSSLVHVAKYEFLQQGMGIFLIDDDIYRAFYPKADEILKKCPEHYVPITAIGSASVTPKMLRYASENRLNFIFDGTLKNDRIIQTAMSWKDYHINWKVMATSRIESLLSIFERNATLKKIGEGRLITVDAHNETYDGIGPTLLTLEQIDNIGVIQVYGRGKECFKPILYYDSSQSGLYPSAYVALQSVRNLDAAKCKSNDIAGRIDALISSSTSQNPAELQALHKLMQIIDSEISK